MAKKSIYKHVIGNEPKLRAKEDAKGGGNPKLSKTGPKMVKK